MMMYDEFINNIIKLRGRFGIKDGEYYEEHHITPKSYGGTDDPSNLIWLYASEHFLAHQILAKQYPDNYKFVTAYWMMAHCGNNKYQERYECTAEEYAEAREKFAKVQSERMSGRVVSEETRKKNSEAHKGLHSGEKNPMYGKPSPTKGKKKTDETRKKMSEAHRGKISPLRKPVYCKELDEYFSCAQDAEKKYGFNHRHINECCNNSGKRKTCGKHPVTGEKLHWCYIEDIDIDEVKICI